MGLRRALRALLVALAAVAAALAIRTSAAVRDPILVLVSIDGFRWDYLDRLPATNLRALAARGIRAKEMTPSFPVLTFPNHYTIVTGLYPAHHGIVANVIVDPLIPIRFTMSTAEAVTDSRWWGGEPIWVTAVREGRRSAAMFWPGSEAEIGGVRPTFWTPYDGKMPASARTSRVLDWLALPDAERPSFLTLYFDDVDHSGHDYGPDSVETRNAVATVDREIGTLVAGIGRLGLEDRTTVVVVSDHGMAPMSERRTIFLEDYIDASAVDIVEANAFLSLAPRDAGTSSVTAVYERLRNAHPRLRVFTRDTLPARLHYTGNPRITPIVGIPDAGWSVTTRARRQRRHDDGRRPEAGAHGFDPANTIMHALFVAAGPEVPRGLVIPSIENVHLYNFMCAVLNLTPAPNDGDPARVSGWLRRSP